MDDFKGRQFKGEIILWAVRWYCKYGISYRELEEMLEERGVELDHTTIYRWVQRYAPELQKRLKWFTKSSFYLSWQVDETYIKVKGKWAYLYRAVNKDGDTIDFYLSPTRNAKAAKRFLSKALAQRKEWEKPRVINTDKAPTYGIAIQELKAEGKLPKETEHRQVKYFNNIVESDNARFKQPLKPMRSFKSFACAENTIAGMEAMGMLRKRQFTEMDTYKTEVDFIHSLFGLTA